ncbi:hypothetical protein [uncultured Hyphomicrobium sp.]|uniref:hypothetical protein n=1 Tax=uncultured Hyphomicrobium sp. TaxID=194373 RepID=UPI0025F14B78|nr:hypothetical protein [uncultured Hyphomicrobium sp.]
MLIDEKIASQLEIRRAKLKHWLADEAPYTSADQRHLTANTPEQAYWHHGYQAALTDVLRLAGRDLSQRSSNKDKSS